MTRSSRLVASALLAAALTSVAAASPVPPPHRAATSAATSAAPSGATSGTATTGDDVSVPTIGVLAGADHRCTATVVASASGSLLVTAAHCVHTGGRWTLDGMRFYPAYRDGTAPDGVWDVERAWVPQAWTDGDGRRGDTGGSPEHDVAFVRLSPDADGRTAQDVLGAEGIRFDTVPGQTVTQIGYPATGAYDGTRARTCTARTAAVRFGGGDAVSLGCDFTPGASGAPWLRGGRAGTGSAWVGGVLSMVGDDGTDYGVLFDAETERLYHGADEGSVDQGSTG